ncbi:prepilin-type N-terminal cleavage/methylation domain-containing protein [Desulfotruncus alcoholivorax]|uniref:prepilin-type N-terminal cleavage/methylation domain-containing protein n=1 Tax=Desulfotruncus alcoholivorax TaxID=265477 RepID=UPI0004895640|nr:prepilin-type N-terminal cleavage/methylation domain-containing protein [Desulfotruncus alcoholivorax]
MKRNQRGFTLIELVIVLALLSVVIALGYTIYFFGVNSFTMEEAQWKVQTNIQQAGMFITSDVRNAIDLEVLDSTPESFNFSNNDNYIYLDKVTDGSDTKYRVKKKDKNGSTDISDAVIDELSFTLDKNEIGNYTLNFNIKGNLEDAHGYNIVSNVMLNNTEALDKSLEGRDLNPVVQPPKRMAIRYVKP